MKIPADKVQSIKQSAEKGDPLAQFIVGAMYYTGQHAKRDFHVAASWYLKAAEQGFPRAELNLGNMYGAGRGVVRDIIKAAFWTERAAQHGLPQAQACLGLDFLAGNGVPWDKTLAYKWLSIAVTNDRSLLLYRIYRRMLGWFLTTKQRCAAEQEAASWLGEQRKRGQSPST